MPKGFYYCKHALHTCTEYYVPDRVVFPRKPSFYLSCAPLLSCRLPSCHPVNSLSFIISSAHFYLNRRLDRKRLSSPGAFGGACMLRATERETDLLGVSLQTQMLAVHL